MTTLLVVLAFLVLVLGFLGATLAVGSLLAKVMCGLCTPRAPDPEMTALLEQCERDLAAS